MSRAMFSALRWRRGKWKDGSRQQPNPGLLALTTSAPQPPALYNPSLIPRLHPAFRHLQYGTRFSVLQATESWAGPGNEATTILYMIMYCTGSPEAPVAYPTATHYMPISSDCQFSLSSSSLPHNKNVSLFPAEAKHLGSPFSAGPLWQLFILSEQCRE